MEEKRKGVFKRLYYNPFYVTYRGKGSKEYTEVFEVRKYWILLAWQLIKSLYIVGSMGCKKLKYQKFSFLEIVHSKKRVSEEKKRINYYPFGLKHKGYNNVITSTNIALKYKFGGKEYQDELGLDWYDITARNYDPALGRWMNIDPLAEQMRRHSPYNYAFNNPIYFIDADGMSPSSGDQDDFDGKPKKKKDSRTEEFLNGKTYTSGGFDGNSFSFSGGEGSSEKSSLSKKGDPPNIFTKMLKEHKAKWAAMGHGEKEQDNVGGINNSSLATAIGGVLFTGAEALYSKGRFWLGANGKFYDFKFNGNGVTGGVNSFAQSSSKLLSRVGYIAGVYGTYKTNEQWRSGEKTTGGMIQDQIFNFAGYFPGPPAAASLGYNLGYLIEDLCNCNIQINWGNLKKGKNLFDDGKDRPYESIFTDKFLKR